MTTALSPNNLAGTLLSEAAVSPGTYSSGPITQYGKGAIFGINVTQLTGTLTLTLQGLDQASGSYYTVLQGTLTAGFTEMMIYPGVTVVANLTASRMLPVVFQAQAVLTGTSASFTIGTSIFS